ncbi:MAG: DUF3870 domain-containing protein [Peptococcaceae bacterium]|jgi:hypothetical protein|nr:DUF3870 domain-containing protein [Peptococcaceae bacterium]
MAAGQKSYLFSGMALLPEKTDLSRHRYLTIIMEIDLADGMIKNCDVPIYSGIHKEFIANIFVGKSLDSGYEGFAREIDERVHSITKNTLLQAFQSLYNRYITTRRSKRDSDGDSDSDSDKDKDKDKDKDGARLPDGDGPGRAFPEGEAGGCGKRDGK